MKHKYIVKTNGYLSYQRSIPTDLQDHPAFKGISEGAHRSLSYERPEENLFFIRIETNDGEQIEIRLTLVE